jgi:Ni,Fe-hydrogenase III small subunit/ferredoxin-like protein FixX
MNEWVLEGLHRGIKSTRYPDAEERAPGVSPGLPACPGEMSPEDAHRLELTCPTGAIKAPGGRLMIDYRDCIHCFRCVRGVGVSMNWRPGYQWAYLTSRNQAEAKRWPNGFARALNIRVVDAGDCGACLNEVRQLNNPYYNMHRLGFFITPTPRQADILLVVGSVTDQMKLPLLEAYEAMPTPKLVMAVGACALSCGAFGQSFVAGCGVGGVLPIDVEVPGFPPPPLAILHGLLVAAGRKASAPPSDASPIEGGSERVA